jgi:hypothetical protein
MLSSKDEYLIRMEHLLGNGMFASSTHDKMQAQNEEN